MPFQGFGLKKNKITKIGTNKEDLLWVEKFIK